MLRIYALILLLFLAGLTAYSQAVGDYRSFQTGPWSDVNTWERFDGGSWVNPAPSTPTSADGVITLMNGHEITVTANVTVDQIEYENDFSGSTGSLIVGSGVVLSVNNGTGNDIRLLNDFTTFALLQINGTLNLSSGATIVDDDYGNLGIGPTAVTPDTYKVTNGGTHIHNVAGSSATVPNADWQVGSTCRLNVLANFSPDIDVNASFYDFIYDGTSQTGLIDLNSLLDDINGDFSILSTNNNILRLVSGLSSTLNYDGDVSIQGNSRVQLNATSNPTTVNIGGDFEIASTSASINAISLNATGTIVINVGGELIKSNSASVTLAAAPTGTTILNLSDGFSLTGGAITCSSSITTGSSTINFVGTGSSSFINSGTISNAINFVIQSGKILNLGTSAITGTGTFTNNGTVILSSPHASGAIQSSPTSNGNIQVSGTRTFTAGTTVILDGAQATGSGFPTNVNVTITNNSSVVLTNSLIISSSRLLTINQGSTLAIGTNTLTINGNISTDGGLGFFAGSSTSNLSIGGSGSIGDFIVFSSDATAFLNDFTINRNSGTVYFRSRLTTEGSFNHTAGDMEMIGFLLRINGDYNHTAGNFIMGNTSGLWVYGSNPSTLDPFTFSTGSALYDLDMNRAGATFTLSSDLVVSRLILNAGTFNNSGATLTMDNSSILTRRSGSMTAAPVAAGSYSVVYDNSGLMTTSFELPSGSTALASLTKSNTGTLNLNSDITINGDLEFIGSGFTAGNHIITMNGAEITSSASASLETSTFVFNSTTSLIGGLTPVNPVFGNITISGTGDFTPNLQYSINGNLVDNGILNPNDVTFGVSTTVSGTGTPSFNDVTITGILTASSGTMNVAGDFTNNGTFNRGGGTVVFNGVTSIGGSAASTFSNLTVEGNLTAPNSNVLSLTRNFTNNGTFVHNSGTVAFIGTNQQLIQGSSVTTFYNMNVNNTGGPPSLSVEDDANLAGILTLEGTSIFDADGSSNTSVFTLLSTNDAPPTDAAIAAIPATASFIGNVTYQRYMSIEGGNSTRIYRYISSPVSGATVADLQGEIPVTGPFTGASTCSGCVTANQSMWSYNESVLGNLDQGYVNFPASANTETFQPSRGYTLFVRGNILGGPTWNLRGPINSGNIDFGITFTSTGNLADDGWNLVGNPYPSTIDWDDPDWTKSSISNVIYMRDNGRGTIATYNGTTGVNNGTNLIASGQGFWVQANAAAPSLIATENVKAPGATDTDFEFFRKEAPQDLIRISLVQGNKVDETVVHFREDALEGADRVDAWKLQNENVFNISTVNSEGRKLAINSLPSLDCSKQIPLSITEVKPGNYQFRFTELESFNHNPNIKLIDNFTNTTFDVGSGNPYSFAVTTDEFSYSAERFSLLFTLPDFDQNFAFTAADVCEEANALISIQDSKTDALYTLYIGEEVVSDELHGNGGMLSMEVSKEKLALGENEITIRSVSSYCSSTKLDKVAIVHVADKPPIQSAVVNSACLTGPVSIEVSGSPSGLYNWYRSEASTEPIAEQNGNIFVTEELIKSKTYFVATVNELGCEGERKSILAEVVQYDPTEITLNELTGALSSSSPTNNQWYLNGELLDGEIEQQIVPELPGTYRLEVTHGAGCISVDEFDFVITANEELLRERILVYPVPVSDILTVKIPTSIEVKKINVHNSLGQIVGEIQLSSKNGINTGEYDMRLTPSGLYSLSMYLKSGHITQFKVLKK